MKKIPYTVIGDNREGIFFNEKGGNGMNDHRIPREGELFKIVEIEGYTFQLRYGYYEASDRSFLEPVPIYPDLKSVPVYTAQGKPLVTAIQLPCEFYTVPKGETEENCCGDCIYYPGFSHEIAACACLQRIKLDL